MGKKTCVERVMEFTLMPPAECSHLHFFVRLVCSVCGASIGRKLNVIFSWMDIKTRRHTFSNLPGARRLIQQSLQSNRAWDAFRAALWMCLVPRIECGIKHSREKCAETKAASDVTQRECCRRREKCKEKKCRFKCRFSSFWSLKGDQLSLDVRCWMCRRLNTVPGGNKEERKERKIWKRMKEKRWREGVGQIERARLNKWGGEIDSIFLPSYCRPSLISPAACQTERKRKKKNQSQRFICAVRLSSNISVALFVFHKSNFLTENSKTLH